MHHAPPSCRAHLFRSTVECRLPQRISGGVAQAVARAQHNALGHSRFCTSALRRFEPPDKATPCQHCEVHSWRRALHLWFRFVALVSHHHKWEGFWLRWRTGDQEFFLPRVEGTERLRRPGCVHVRRIPSYCTRDKSLTAVFVLSNTSTHPSAPR